MGAGELLDQWTKAILGSGSSLQPVSFFFTGCPVYCATHVWALLAFKTAFLFPLFTKYTRWWSACCVFCHSSHQLGPFASHGRLSLKGAPSLVARTTTTFDLPSPPHSTPFKLTQLLCENGGGTKLSHFNVKNTSFERKNKSFNIWND